MYNKSIQLVMKQTQFNTDASTWPANQTVMRIQGVFVWFLYLFLMPVTGSDSD